MKNLLLLAVSIKFESPFPESENALRNGLSLALGLLGAISVLVIVISGIRLSLSRGNPDAIGKLRGTLIFAAIGLIISISASTIITFVIDRVG